MTLIIGMKYDKGVILIGDTKITESPTSFYHDNKIVSPIPSIAIGSAGFTQLAKEFNPKINLIVEQRISEYRLANMRELNGTGIDIEDIEKGNKPNIELPFKYTIFNVLDDCATLTKQLAENGKIYGNNPIESLVGIIMGDIATLYQIDCNGFKVEVPYASIGSGTDHIGNYLKKNYSRDITLNQAILLGTFLIKYVEMLEFDNNVGLEKGKLPQLFIVSKEEFGDYSPKEEDKLEILNDVQKRVDTIRRSLLLGINKGKIINKPVWGKSK